jgi:xanthine dehydrogenase small subunit
LIRFILNDKEITTSLPAGTALLDFIRYHKNLNGTKIGCREGDCGACTILAGEMVGDKLVYKSATSCLMALGNAHGKHIVTIEGVNIQQLNFIQEAFAIEGATQCGFCTPGFIMSLVGFCVKHSTQDGLTALDAVSGNICRCTGYKSIERAVAMVADKMAHCGEEDAIGYAVANNILPAYFATIQPILLNYQLQQRSSVPVNTGAQKFLGGGTDLFVQQHDAMHDADISLLFDKTHLNGIHQSGTACWMGASVTVTDMLESSVFRKHFPNLVQYLRLVSSTPIRNMATIAGNFVNASPIGDLTVFFLALDAQLVLSDGISTRELPLRQFYKGYKTLDKLPGEHIEKIWFELPEAGALFNFEKVCKRTHLDIASVNTAISIQHNNDVIQQAGLSAGGVGPVPLFLRQTSLFLQGKKVTEAMVEQAIEIAQSEISPISDVRGTAVYKRFLLSQLLRAHFISLFTALDAGKLVKV